MKHRDARAIRSMRGRTAGGHLTHGDVVQGVLGQGAGPDSEAGMAECEWKLFSQPYKQRLGRQEAEAPSVSTCSRPAPGLPCGLLRHVL